MYLKSVVALSFSLLFSVFSIGQNLPTIDEILLQAEKQTTEYQETFRNLLAVETKTFIDFDKNENVGKENKVESNFLVYQSSKNNKLSFELRNVISVDGKPIPNSQEKADTFFAELNKTSTLRSELEKIQKTSSKYDKTLEISGLTLYEGIILSPNLRQYFDFQLKGIEGYQGKEVFVLNYRQNKPSPYILINKKGADLSNPSLEFDVEIPGNLKKNELILQGKLFIDTQTYQIRREERELVIKIDEPEVLLKTELNYQDSEYGILVPQEIVLWLNQAKKKDGKFITVKDSKIIFNYSKFRKTETDVKILDDTVN